MELVYILIIACWVIFALYWGVSSLFQKESSERPVFTGFNIIAQILFAFPFVILVRSDWFMANNRIVSQSIAVEIISVVICVLGLIICIWARKTLGGNWSKSIDYKKNHVMVEDGPYKFVRHPIYSGFLLMFFGLALAVGTLGAFLGVVILFLGVLMRIKQEEDLLTRNFQLKYINYKKRTKYLIPYVI